MSLIKCPECNKEISSTIDKCIHCGFKIHQEQGNTINDRNKQISPLAILLLIVSLVIAVTAIVFVFNDINNTYKKNMDTINEMSKSKVSFNCPYCRIRVTVNEDSLQKVSGGYRYMCTNCSKLLHIDKKTNTVTMLDY